MSKDAMRSEYCSRIESIFLMQAWFSFSSSIDFGLVESRLVF